MRDQLQFDTIGNDVIQSGEDLMQFPEHDLPHIISRKLLACGSATSLQAQSSTQCQSQTISRLNDADTDPSEIPSNSEAQSLSVCFTLCSYEKGTSSPLMAKSKCDEYSKAIQSLKPAIQVQTTDVPILKSKPDDYTQALNLIPQIDEAIYVHFVAIAKCMFGIGIPLTITRERGNGFSIGPCAISADWHTSYSESMPSDSKLAFHHVPLPADCCNCPMVLADKSSRTCSGGKRNGRQTQQKNSRGYSSSEQRASPLKKNQSSGRRFNSSRSGGGGGGDDKRNRRNQKKNPFPALPNGKSFKRHKEKEVKYQRDWKMAKQQQFDHDLHSVHFSHKGEQKPNHRSKSRMLNLEISQKRMNNEVRQKHDCVHASPASITSQNSNLPLRQLGRSYANVVKQKLLHNAVESICNTQSKGTLDCVGMRFESHDVKAFCVLMEPHIPSFNVYTSASPITCTEMQSSVVFRKFCFQKEGFFVVYEMALQRKKRVFAVHSIESEWHGQIASPEPQMPNTFIGMLLLFFSFMFVYSYLYSCVAASCCVTLGILSSY